MSRLHFQFNESGSTMVTIPSVDIVLDNSFFTQESQSYRFGTINHDRIVFFAWFPFSHVLCRAVLSLSDPCCATVSLIVLCCTAKASSLTQQIFFHHGLSCSLQLLSLQSSPPAGLSIIHRHKTTARTLHAVENNSFSQVALLSNLQLKHYMALPSRHQTSM